MKVPTSTRDLSYYTVAVRVILIGEYFSPSFPCVSTAFFFVPGSISFSPIIRMFLSIAQLCNILVVLDLCFQIYLRIVPVSSLLSAEFPE